MSEAITPTNILQAHLQICTELHELLLEENRVMRATSAAPPDALLERKKSLLPKLDESLRQLRGINESRTALSRDEAARVEEARRKLMQILMLDRENERLLLKAALPPKLKAAYQPVVPGQVARAYQKYGPAASPGGGNEETA